MSTLTSVYGRSRRRLIVFGSFLAIAFHGGVVCEYFRIRIATIWQICVLFAGVFESQFWPDGWPNMRSIFRRDGVLLAPSCATNFTSDPNSLCAEQELSFGAIYTIGAWSNQAARLVLGVMLDSLGPCVTGVLSALLFAFGTLAFALTPDSAVGLAVGFFFIGGGGAGIQLSVQSCAILFPRHRSTIIASLSGAFQLASGIFLVFNVLHLQGMSYQSMILAQCVLAAVTALVLSLMLPDQPFGTAEARMTGRACAALGCRGAGRGAGAGGGEDGKQVAASSAGKPAPVAMVLSLRQRSFRDQASSAEYLLMLTFFAIGVLQCQFTIASIGIQLERKGDLDGSATRYFGTCMSLGCLWTPRAYAASSHPSRP